MRRFLATLCEQTWAQIAGITLLSAICVAASLQVIPIDKLMPDFLCYWTAGTIVTMGESPYDANLQARIQHQLGWDRARDGLGIYDFVPYYYPPWFAIIFASLVPLGFEGAKVASYFLNIELLCLSGYFLSATAKGVARAIPLVLVPVFVFSLASLLMGQTAIAMLFLIALEWKLLERESDRAAGMVLALLTTKPQLGAILVLALLLWAARQRRWRVAQGFLLALGLLSLTASFVVPYWPLEMVRASSITRPPTHYLPWIGTTWFLLLRTVGFPSWSLWPSYLILAVPFLALVVTAALDRSRPVSEVISLGTLATFIVAPYARHYDFPILLVPLFVLMGGRLSELAGAALMVVLLVLPYLHMGAMMEFRRKYPTSQNFPECTFLWVPALLTGAWLVYEAGQKRRGLGQQLRAHTASRESC